MDQQLRPPAGRSRHARLRPPRQLCAWRGRMTLSLCWRVHENDSLIALFKKKMNKSNEARQQPPATVALLRSRTKIRLCVWDQAFIGHSWFFVLGTSAKEFWRPKRRQFIMNWMILMRPLLSYYDELNIYLSSNNFLLPKKDGKMSWGTLQGKEHLTPTLIAAFSWKF